jgi:hypothetical protein
MARSRTMSLKPAAASSLLSILRCRQSDDTRRSITMLRMLPCAVATYNLLRSIFAPPKACLMSCSASLRLSSSRTRLIGAYCSLRWEPCRPQAELATDRGPSTVKSAYAILLRARMSLSARIHPSCKLGGMILLRCDSEGSDANAKETIDLPKWHGIACRALG